MAFNWKAVRECKTPEESFYRLIGEMLHRNASPRDLIELRDFLLNHNPGSDALISLGEALHCTTEGADAGFRLWTAWSRGVQGPEFDILEHGRRWRTFGAGASLEEETATDEEPAFVDEEPETDEDLDVEPFEEDSTSLTGPTDIFQVQRRTPENRGRGTRTGDLVRGGTAVVGKSSSSLIDLLPEREGWEMKLFGRVFENVTNEELLTLLRRGILGAAEVKWESAYIPILIHPEFDALARTLRDEAFRLLDGSKSASVPRLTLHPKQP